MKKKLTPLPESRGGHACSDCLTLTKLTWLGVLKFLCGENLAGLEIATDTGAFATKIFALATKICRQVANLRPVCCRSFGHMLATGDYFKPKLIKEYHIEESCVLFINKNSKSSGKILLNLP